MNVNTSYAKAKCMADAMAQFEMIYRHKGFSPYWIESNGGKVWLWTFKCTDRNDDPWTITLDIHDITQDKVERDDA